MKLILVLPISFCLLFPSKTLGSRTDQVSSVCESFAAGNIDALKTLEYLDINILGTIPYMIDGDIKMTESVAISQYLVEKYGPTDLQVKPDEKDYPSYLNWLFHSDATLTFPQII